ncbi:MAG TPA: DNA repair exonuclease [Candidatus Nanoarchaeia archaeon]|nr:DNA repair exonuclease [Candidatus Nanoarchaeia archaeon]
MKFAHMADCHLGGWRQPELNELNFKSFQFALKKVALEKVDFLIIAGDLFDSPYPPIDTLKDTFEEFRKLKEAKIPVFIIAGSHDYSVSGKTFLDVLEKAGFCTNVSTIEERAGKLMLHPTIHNNVALYGYPGRKSGLEVEDVGRIVLQDAPGLYKILVLHTTLADAMPNLPIYAVDEKKLPKVDYVALGHLHIHYHKENRIYAGPTFPNSLSELEDLGAGSFYIVENGKPRKEIIQLKKTAILDIEINDAHTATEKILKQMESEDIEDKIVLLKIYGIIEKGSTTDIDYVPIEVFARKKKVFVLLKTTTKLFIAEPALKMDITETVNMEEAIVAKFKGKNEHIFNHLIEPLLRSLHIPRQEDEKAAVFEERLKAEAKKVLEL